MMFDMPVEKTENVSVPMVANEHTITEKDKPEPKSALALGLPASWSIEPPAVIVRRKARAI
jgi:hypothetical protein